MTRIHAGTRKSFVVIKKARACATTTQRPRHWQALVLTPLLSSIEKSRVDHQGRFWPGLGLPLCKLGEQMISAERHAEYARGYLALGLLKESSLELAKIARSDHELPVVLSTRIELHTQEKNWPKVILAARALARQCPTSETGWIGWAYALREMNKVEEAFSVLSQVEKHPSPCSALVHYNLACYLCLLGQQSVALTHLRKAFLLEPDFKPESLHDRDLEPLWPEIRSGMQDQSRPPERNN